MEVIKLSRLLYDKNNESMNIGMSESSFVALINLYFPTLFRTANE